MVALVGMTGNGTGGYDFCKNRLTRLHYSCNNSGNIGDEGEKVGINNEGVTGGTNVFIFRGFRAVDVGRYIRDWQDLGGIV